MKIDYPAQTMTNPKNRTWIEGEKIQSIKNTINYQHPDQKEHESKEKMEEKKEKKKRTKEANAKKPRKIRNWRKERVKTIPHRTPRTTQNQPANRHPRPALTNQAAARSLARKEKNEGESKIEGKKNTINQKYNQLATPIPEITWIEGEDGRKKKKKRTEEANAKKPSKSKGKKIQSIKNTIN